MPSLKGRSRALTSVSERWQQELGKRGNNVWGLVFGEREVISKMVGCFDKMGRCLEDNASQEQRVRS
jgi:hypothetical protein